MLTKISCPTIVAEGNHLRGDLYFNSETYLYGTLEGNIHNESRESLQIGKSGWIYGSVFSEGPIFVEGRVEGNITSSTQITLRPTATVLGTLICPMIRVESGAYLDGELKMDSKLPVFIPTPLAA